ncbi:hypothetical protein L218DRAFT_622087 [Marasmius fiardii PR-910]|nr:hypothetical protein L218DRAFT_622087 [Marasmius fiardii PR-910]
MQFNGSAYNFRQLYLNFILDDQPAGSFNRTLTDNFQFNVSVFSRNNLEIKNHTFVMELNDPTLDSFVLFDYASYMYNDSAGPPEVQHVEFDLSEEKQKPHPEVTILFAMAGSITGISLLLVYWHGGALIIRRKVELIMKIMHRLIVKPISDWIDRRSHLRSLRRRIPRALEATEYSYRYDSSAQPSYSRLLGDTRSQYIFGVLSEWAHTSLFKKGITGVYWLQGSENSWRSALAQKLAKGCEGKELLATFFFSSRDPNRNNPQYLALAIAHDLNRQQPDGRPGWFRLEEETVESQFKMLVVGTFLNWRTRLYDGFRFPLRIMMASSTLIILDGLDECGSDSEQERVLSLVLSAMEKKLPVRFLICSRPTEHLRQQFDKPDLHRYTRILSLDNDANTPLANRNIKAVTPRAADESSSMV